MESPYKKVIVYDLETGGLNYSHNAVTEIAMVAIDLETLKIEDRFSCIIKPTFDLDNRLMDSTKEARVIFKLVAERDPETKVASIMYKGKRLTIKDLEPIEQDLGLFDLLIERKGTQFNSEQVALLESDSKYGDIAKLYFDKTYNPQALSVTHMSKEMLLNEGIEQDQAIDLITAFIEKYTIGNAKPILAGHNIKKFDSPFLEKLLRRRGHDLYKITNETMTIDTLEWSRLRWFELPSYSLGVCVNASGLTLKEAHRALPDTEANAEFLIKMLKGLRGEGSSEVVYEKRKYNFNF